MEQAQVNQHENCGTGTCGKCKATAPLAGLFTPACEHYKEPWCFACVFMGIISNAVCYKCEGPFVLGLLVFEMDDGRLGPLAICFECQKGAGQPDMVFASSDRGVVPEADKSQ